MHVQGRQLDPREAPSSVLVHYVGQDTAAGGQELFELFLVTLHVNGNSHILLHAWLHEAVSLQDESPSECNCGRDIPLGKPSTT